MKYFTYDTNLRDRNLYTSTVNTPFGIKRYFSSLDSEIFFGATQIEEVFAIDGIGRLAYKALSEGDIPFVMGYNMFLAVLTVIGTLFSDIMYSVVDPRVKLGK